ncbi:MAG: F0F1 ATP synthase subunit B [Planctomycetaceae bacterium]|nr:F0F1 ATP synthase subunit B [Planctomycetaceae bacterium]
MRRSSWKLASISGLLTLVLGLALVTQTAVAADEGHPAPAAEAGHGEAGHGEAGHGDAGHGDAAHGGHGDGHHETNLSPLTIEPDLAIYTFVVFLVLFVVLAKFAWGPIAEGLDKREKGIADNIAAAQRSNEEAKALLAQYETKLAAAREEVRGILDEARRDAEFTQQQILANPPAAAAATRERAVREIDAASAVAMKELAEHGSQLAVQLAGKIVGSELNSAGHARLIQDALTKFTGNRHN